MFDNLIAKYHDIQARRAEGEGGFTLIELLVVVVIIGILIAIAIPLYLNYQTGAHNKAAQSDARAVVSAAEQCISDNGVVPGTQTQVTNAKGPITLCGTGASARTVNLSDGTTLTFTNVGNKTYTIATTNSNGDTNYDYDSSVGGSVKAGPTAP